MPFKFAVVPTETCYLCGGEGYLYDETTDHERETGYPLTIKTECPECHGAGELAVEPED